MSQTDTKSGDKPNWWIYGGDGTAETRLQRLPAPPPWRRFDQQTQKDKGKHFIASREDFDMVNAALYLRRPLLITGKPGVGKTSLTYAVADDLGLGEVLRWSITTSTVLKEGLYHYDAIARLQDASLEKTLQEQKREHPVGKATPLEPPPIGRYLRLGPLGTAFATSRPNRPRVLLVDEIDKSDIDLPNNLLHIFEEGEFAIPELERLPQPTVLILPSDAPKEATLESHGITVERGKLRCEAFPLVIMTSNAEREFPPAFLRRCLRLDMALPDRGTLKDIVKTHLFGHGEKPLAGELETRIDRIIGDFLQRREREELAADQLLNAIYMVLRDVEPEHPQPDRKTLIDALLRPLSD